MIIFRIRQLNQCTAVEVRPLLNCQSRSTTFPTTILIRIHKEFFSHLLINNIFRIRP